jgi:hypothetical protein
MLPMQVLQCVRKGFALTSPARVEVMRGCVDLDVIEESWVPRWAVEASVSLESLGYGPQQVSALFAQGRARVMAELTALAQAGTIPRPLEPRHAYEQTSIDQPTALALTAALADHRASCSICLAQHQCLDSDLLEEEMEALFPQDRRRHRRPA